MYVTVLFHIRFLMETFSTKTTNKRPYGLMVKKSRKKRFRISFIQLDSKLVSKCLKIIYLLFE